MFFRQLQCGRVLMAFFATCTLSIPTALHALSLDEAQRLATQTPSLKAEAAKIEAARNAAIPAAELPDPKLVLGLQSVPIEGDQRWSVDQDDMTMQMVGLMQEVPNRAKRRARAETANAAIKVAAAQQRVEQLNVRLETAQAWIATHTVERQLAMFDELFAENRLLTETVRAQIAGGQGLAADEVAPRQEVALLAERRDELEERRTQARAALRRWIGPAADNPLSGSVPNWPIDAQRYAQRQAQRPELQLYDPMHDEVKARISEAVAQKKSDWSWEVDYLRRGREFGDMVNLSVSFSLPVFQASRQNPAIAAQYAALDQLEAEREAAERAYAAQLASELAEQQRLSRALERYRNSLLPLAREKVVLSMAGYRAAKGELNAVLMARRELLETRLKQTDLEGLEAIARARLHYAYGEMSE